MNAYHHGLAAAIALLALAEVKSGRKPRPPVKREEGPPQPAKRAAPAGRNHPCPCGSGKKYKRCCLGGKATKE